MTTITKISDEVLRDLFAMNAPEPTQGDVELVQRGYKNLNPYNQHDKPKMPSRMEIECQIRYKWADTMLKVRSTDK